MRTQPAPVINFTGINEFRVICIPPLFSVFHHNIFFFIIFRQRFRQNISTTNKKQIIDVNTELNASSNLENVEKMITANDVRVHIISLPRVIIDKIQNNDKKHLMKLVVNGSDSYNVTFCPSRNYLSQVTEIFRKYGLLQDDKTVVEKKAKWAIDDKQIIYLTIV